MGADKKRKAIRLGKVSQESAIGVKLHLEKLIEAGFTVEKISYFNTFLFPAISLVRLINNVLKRKGGSDVDLPSPIVNYVLEKIFSAEMFFLRFMDFPIGVSVLAVVRK